MIADGFVGPEYRSILAHPRFAPDGTVGYLAVRGDDLYRVRMVPAPPDP